MTKKIKFQSPVGMHDILPEDWPYFDKVLKVCQNMADFYGFKRIETPIIEKADLFLRGIGKDTDIVEKEMYDFKTKGGDYLVLRPEGTASIARAYIEHGMNSLPQPVKLWHFGPFFRHEKPQLGRYRQFWQFGFEILGDVSPVIDVQVIQIFYNILRELKFKNLVVKINSMGCLHCRSYYRKLLVSYMRSRKNSLCVSCRKRIKTNPLRILDCKEEKCQRVCSQAPQLIDHLCDDCKSHFKQVLEFLDELKIPYDLDPYLVRGLDYYTKTVFEIYGLDQEINQGALLGGGRYDDLVKLLGGRETPGCGGACGIERVVNLMKERPIRTSRTDSPNIFLAQIGNLAKKKSLVLAEEFRKARIPIAESFNKDSLKGQLNKANKIGVDHCLIMGQKEAVENTIIIRNMSSGKQREVKIEKIIKEVKKILDK
jgi:histidyl-tRNA synthetase